MSNTEAVESMPSNDRVPSWFYLVVTLLALGVISIAGYLSFLGFTSAATVSGCGAGVTCDAVLASRWSRVLFVPVSLLAVLMYSTLVVLLWWQRGLTGESRKRCWSALMVLTGAVAGAAVWFLFLQGIWLGSWCVWCTLSHVLGLTMVVIVFAVTWRHASSLFQIETENVSSLKRRHFTLGNFFWGILLAGGLASAQALQPVSVYRLQSVDVGKDVDQSTVDDRSFSLLDDQLKIRLPEQPHVGSLDGKHVIVLMADYACPHCREIHERIMDLRRDPSVGPQLLTISLPMAVWPGCNPHVSPYVSDRFAQSCEIAELSLAVWRASPHAWPAFDVWLWSHEQLPKYEVIRKRAVELVGEQSLTQVLEQGWPKEQLERNVQAFGDAEAERVPLTIFPGKAAIAGPIDSVEDLRDLLGVEPPALLSK